MAGDWIPYCKDLPHKEETLYLAEACGLSIAETVFALLQLWSWADGQSADGFLRYVSVAQLSHVCSAPMNRFVPAMCQVGWMRQTNGCIEFVNFERWMGNSAKKRLSAAKRMQKSRANQKSQAEVLRASATDVAPSLREPVTNVAPTVQDRTVLNTTPKPPEGDSLVVPSEKISEEAKNGFAAPAVQSAQNLPRRLVLAADRPDLFPGAKKVFEHYQRTVQTIHQSFAVPEILTLLDAGKTPEQLKACADAYAAHCRKNEILKKARQSAKAFFEETGNWQMYLPENQIQSAINREPEKKPQTPDPLFSKPHLRDGPSMAEINAARHAVGNPSGIASGERSAVQTSDASTQGNGAV